MKKIISIILLLLLSLSLTMAATITPQKGLNLRNTYNITNVGHIDSAEYCIGLDCKTAWWNLGDYWYEKQIGYLSNVTRISFNRTANYTSAQDGDLYWDAEYKTLALKGEDWNNQIGQEVYTLVYNDDSNPLVSGIAVTQTGVNGIYPTVQRADSSSVTTALVLGVTTQTINPGQTGMVTILGIVHNVNTSAYTPGTTLYVDQSGLGTLTNVKPSCPTCNPMSLGQVVVQGEDGSMFVRIRTVETDPIYTAGITNYYNKTEADGLFYLLSNPAGYINSSGIVAAVGNWSLDKSNYNTTSELNTIYYSILNPAEYINASGIVAAVGNWSLDKSNYNTTSELNTIYYSILNPVGYLNASGVVAAVGNWSLDKINYNTTSELNNLYLAISQGARIDAINATAESKAVPGGCPYGYVISNISNNSAPTCQIVPALSTTWTEGYIPAKMNGSMTNSPIYWLNPVYNTSVDEDNLLFYNGDLYIDDTNGIVSINVVPGLESHSAALIVQSEESPGNGSISSTGIYNSVDDTTQFTTTTPVQDALVDATNIYINGTKYYVFSLDNSTVLNIRGNHSAFTATNWTWQPAPYIDVNGENYNERGYTISDNGAWQWAMMVPDDSNNSQFCLQSRNAWFNGNTYAYCADNTGTFTVYGDLSAESVIFPRYAGTINDSATVMLTDGVDNVIIPSNTVNCFDGNTYSGVLRTKTVTGGITGINFPNLSIGLDVTNYIYVECGANPVYKVTTDKNILDTVSNLLVAKVMVPISNLSYNHYTSEPVYGTGLPERSYSRVLDTQEYALSETSQITLSINTSRVIGLGPLTVWAGNTKYIMPALTNNTVLFNVYHSGGNWTTTIDITRTLNNTVYDNGTNIATLTDGYWGIADIYRGVEDQDHILLVYHDHEHVNYEQANAETFTTPTPSFVSKHGVYVGRIIYQKGNTSAMYAQSYVVGTTFTGGGTVTNHNSLSGLDGGSGGAYYHLGLTDYTKVINSVWNSINTTANIQGLGFNTTAQLNNLYYSISNPAGYLNATGAATALVNTTIARTGNCVGLVVQNITTNGPQCVNISSGTFYTAGTGLTLTGTIFSLNTTYTNTLYYGISNPSGYLNYSGLPIVDVTTASSKYLLVTGTTNKSLTINETALNATADARIVNSGWVRSQFYNITEDQANDSATYLPKVNPIVTTGNLSIPNGNCISGASGGYICFNSTHTWIG